MSVLHDVCTTTITKMICSISCHNKNIFWLCKTLTIVRNGLSRLSRWYVAIMIHFLVQWDTTVLYNNKKGEYLYTVLDLYFTFSLLLSMTLGIQSSFCGHSLPNCASGAPVLLHRCHSCRFLDCFYCPLFIACINLSMYLNIMVCGWLICSLKIYWLKSSFYHQLYCKE